MNGTGKGNGGVPPPFDTSELVPHLFRTEYSKIVSVLIKHFGLERIDVAEDIASEAFLTALEVWTFRGIPENPTAWIYAVAKNKARNHRARAHKFSETALDESVSAPIEDLDFSEWNINDSQLRLLFTLCHPAISVEMQIGLSLRILFGLSIEEIADAFLTSKEVINKRLFRAKETFRRQNISLEMPAEEEITTRLDAVIATLYLLFGEGYYSESHAEVLREHFCGEAMRLCSLLLEEERTRQPQAMALLALMCFHSSRFKARKGEGGEAVLYEDQDTSLWDRELISQGARLLNMAAQGSKVSKYHIEACIAYWHSVREDSEEKWTSILQLHDQLLALESSPTAAINRIYAISKVKGNREALIEAEKLNCPNNPYYFTLVGVLHRDTNPQKAKQNFLRAYALAKTPTDKSLIQRKIDALPLQ